MKSSDEERLARVVAAATAAAVLAAQGQGQNRRNRWGWVSPAIAGAGVLAALIVGLGPLVVANLDARLHTPSARIDAVLGASRDNHVSGRKQTFELALNGHRHSGTFFLVVQPVGNGNKQLYPVRVPQPTDTGAQCPHGNKRVVCATVLVGAETDSGPFQVSAYFVPKEDVAAFDDRAVVGEPFEGRMIPGRLHELDALTVTRDL